MLDRIRNLCLRKKISIAKLERDLGFANGSIAKSDEKIQANRLNAIAEYFGVTMEYLLYGRTRDSSIMPLLEMMADMGYEICDFVNGGIYYEKWANSGDFEPKLGDDRVFEIYVRQKLKGIPDHVSNWRSEDFYALLDDIQNLISQRIHNIEPIDTSFKQDLYERYMKCKYKSAVDRLLFLDEIIDNGDRT